MGTKMDIIEKMSETEWLRMIYEIQTQRLVDMIIRMNQAEMKNKYYKNIVSELRREKARCNPIFSQKTFHITRQPCLMKMRKTDLEMLHDSMTTFDISYREMPTLVSS
jgi:hypothetical protein